ncbi:hypothetical protein [Vacuolonema iberomarrocanum]|nr:hypothetical protein [filamentous cyanobacterium LEGE 07170]
MLLAMGAIAHRNSSSPKPYTRLAREHFDLTSRQNIHHRQAQIIAWA